MGLHEVLKFEEGYFDKPKTRGPAGWSAAYHLLHGPEKVAVKELFSEIHDTPNIKDMVK